jgi:hypothetical protein
MKHPKEPTRTAPPARSCRAVVPVCNETPYSNKWTPLHVHPARFNGDLDQWWNGLGILAFERTGMP